LSQPQRSAVTVPSQPGVEATLEHARWAEEEGFDDVWFSDSGGIDALSIAGAIGAMTRRVRIGTAVIPNLQAAFLGHMTAAEALNEIQVVMEDILADATEEQY